MELILVASRRARGLVVSCLGALALAGLSPGASAQLVVGNGGQPGYQHSIAVPPGVAGMTPSISLAYGGEGSGPLGHGWSLQGISAIARCADNLSTDGRVRGVDNSAADKLCLDGQRLIQTDAAGVPLPFPQTNDSAGGSGLLREYRTEKDTYARIRAYGTGAGSPTYFKVWTKDGRIHEYGTDPDANATADAAVTAQASGVITTWLISRSSDLKGNYIDFQYQQRGVAWGSATQGSVIPGHDWSLREIRYTGSATQAPAHKIVFSYVDLPATAPAGKSHDRREAWVAGSKQLNLQQLVQVQTFSNVDVSPLKIKTVRLAYDNGPVTNRSRLVRITECLGVAESPCLPPTTFDYAPGGGEAYQRNAAFAASAMATLTMQSTVIGLGAKRYSNAGVITADFDGDGKTDIIRWSDNPALNQLYLSNGDGTFRQAGNFNLIGADQWLFHSNGCFSTRVADFNGDGLPDLLRFRDRYETTSVNTTTACAGSGSELYLNNGDGTFQRKAITGVTLLEHASQDSYITSHGEIQDGFGWTSGYTFYLLDIDNDGLMDIVTAYLPNQGVTLAPSNDPCVAEVCTQVFKGDGQGGFVEQPTNVTHQNLYARPQGPYALGQPSNVIDLDSDGNLDLARAGLLGTGANLQPPATAWRSLGDFSFVPMTGSGLGSGVGSGCQSPLDFNGDGRVDCLASVSDGGGHLLRESNYNLGSESLVTTSSQLGYTTHTADIVFADVNRDGRDDIIRWADDPTQNKIYLSNGDGTYRQSTGFNLKTANDLLQRSDSAAAFVTGNFTGRGDVEILRMLGSPTPGDGTSNQLYVRQGSTLPPDLLVGVTSPRNLRTTLTWVPLANSTSGALGPRYTSDRGTANAAVFPLYDSIDSSYVVATVTRDSGVGSGQVIEEFSYRGLKLAHDGYGPRGFREVRRQRQAPDGTVLTQVLQQQQRHPYIGLPVRSETWRSTLDQASGLVLSSEVNVHCERSAGATAEANATADAPCPLAAGTRILRPYLYKTTKTGKEPATGEALPVTTTTNRFNDNGDPTQVDTLTSGNAAGVAQTVTSTAKYVYAADNIAGDNWLLGRRQGSTQTNVAPNSLAAVGASAGTAAGASATRGTAPAAALSAPAFATTQIGQSSGATATLSNTGGVAMNLTVPTAAAVSSASGSEFGFAGTTCGASLAAGASCTVTVSFTPTAAGARSGGLNVNTELGVKSAVLSGTGQAPSGSLSAIDFGSVAVGSAPTLTSTLANTGVGPLSMTVPAAASVSGTDFGFVSTTCGSSLAVGGNCAITVRFQPTANAARSGSVSIGTGAGTLSAALNGTGLQSVIAVTGNGAAGLTAQKGGAAGSGTVTFTNSGNQAATLTMSGLSAPYSVSPASCAAPAGGTCAVTVSMATSGALGAQGSQILVATGGTTGAVSAAVAGTVYGSNVYLSANNASALSASKGGASASGTVSFFNSGNQAATLTMSGLSGAYSVAPGSCNIDPGTACTVTVTMSSAGPIGSQGAQTLIATGSTNGAASAAVSGTVTGSVSTLAINSLAYGTVNQNSAAPQNIISWRNDGNVPMTLTGLSNLPAVLSLGVNSCTNVAPGLTCNMVVQLATGTLTSFNQTVSTVGATVNGSVTASGTVQTVPGALFNLSTAATSTTTYTTITLTVANPYSAAQTITAATQSDAGTPGTSTCTVGGSVAASPGSCTFQWVYDRCTARTVNFSVKNAFGTATTSKAIVKGTCL